MFTGLVQQLGKVVALEDVAFGAALTIDPCGWRHHPVAGESIAVNGCCLTVAAAQPDDRIRFDLIHQTLGATALGELRRGDAINLEHAVTPATLLGGHIVQGHVDGVGVVTLVMADPKQWRVRIEPPPELMEYIIDRGSIAVQGVSLTLATISDCWFEVALIPTTLELTNLAALKSGDRVNLETDYLTKTVVTWLRRQGAGMPLEESLRSSGN
jgi:riboflavin synthase